MKKSPKELGADQAGALTAQAALKGAGYKIVRPPENGQLSVYLHCGVTVTVGINGREAYIFRPDPGAPVPPGFEGEYLRVLKIVKGAL